MHDALASGLFLPPSPDQSLLETSVRPSSAVETISDGRWILLDVSLGSYMCRNRLSVGFPSLGIASFHPRNFTLRWKFAPEICARVPWLRSYSTSHRWNIVRRRRRQTWPSGRRSITFEQKYVGKSFLIFKTQERGDI